MYNPHPKVNVVLARPIYARNIGSVSRVMANMGANRLILIDPKCEIGLEARQGAAGAQKHLFESQIYSSWKDFYDKEPSGLVFAFAARMKKETESTTFLESLESLTKGNLLIPNEDIYFLFGPEDHGLTNEDLERVNHVYQLPVFGDFESYNLSHAVLLALYIFNNHCKTSVEMTNPPAPTTTADSFYFPKEALEDWMSALGIEFGDRRTDALKVFKRFLFSRHASPKEFRILEVLIQQTVRKLKSSPKHPSS